MLYGNEVMNNHIISIPLCLTELAVVAGALIIFLKHRSLIFLPTPELFWRVGCLTRI